MASVCALYHCTFIFFSFLIKYWMCGTYNVEQSVVDEEDNRDVKPDAEG